MRAKITANVFNSPKKKLLRSTALAVAAVAAAFLAVHSAWGSPSQATLPYAQVTGPGSLTFSTSGATTLNVPSGTNTMATAGANSNITSLTGLTTPLSAAQGGSGVANSYNFTLGSNFTTQGTGPLQFNTSGATTITFPSGTNTIGTAAFSNLSSMTITGGTASNFSITSSASIYSTKAEVGAASTFNIGSLTAPVDYMNAGMTGTFGTIGVLADINDFSDNANCGTVECSTFQVNANMSTGLVGPRNVVQLYSDFSGASGNTSDSTAQYVTEAEQMWVNHSDNGTAPTPGYSQGFFFVENPQMHVGANGTNLSGVYNTEIDMFSTPGATYQTAIGLVIRDKMLTSGNDGGDTGIQLSGLGNSFGWNYGILFANSESNNTLATGSTVLGGFNGAVIDTGLAGIPTVTAKPAYGIDFSTMHITSDAFLSEGVALSNSSAQIGAAFLTSSPTASGLDVPNYSSTSATVANGGAFPGTYPALIGDTLWAYSCGGEFTVTSVSSGSVTGVSQVTPCTMPTQSGSPIAVSGGSGRGITLTMSWNTLAQRALVLGASGINVQIGPGTAIATNSTNGFLAFPFTAAAPTGACNSTGGAKIEYNPATHSINVCDPTAGAWYHATLTSGAN